MSPRDGTDEAIFHVCTVKNQRWEWTLDARDTGFLPPIHHDNQSNPNHYIYLTAVKQAL